MEGVVAAILQRLLGRYVAGLEKGNIRLKVWSGRVVLENLCLRQDALIGLVPVHMVSGRINRLEMVVPWHKLGSLPVTLDLSGVYVLATPLNEHIWRPEEEEARTWNKKAAALRTRGGELRELLEKLQGSLTPEKDDGALSPGLLTRVLDNVQLTISDIHLRYEDRTNTRVPCALGLRLHAVQIKAIDEQGRTRFVERLPGKPVRKVATINDLSAYLEIGDGRWEARPQEDAPTAGASAGGTPGATSAPTSPATFASEGGAPSDADATDAASRGADRTRSKLAAAPQAACSGGAAASGASSSWASSQAASSDRSGSPSGRGSSPSLPPPSLPSSAPAPNPSNEEPLLLQPLRGRILIVFDTSRHRPPGVPACMAQIDFQVASLRLTHQQYLALNDLLHYATHHRVYLSRLRHAARRPASSPLDNPADWWRFAAAAAKADFATAAAPLDATLLRRRREYIAAYHESLMADMGGPPISKQMSMRVASLERHSFSVGQVLAFRGLAAASAKAALLALQRKLRVEREKARREREKKAAAERRRQIEREKREAERAARVAAREARQAADSQRRAERRELKRREREEKQMREQQERERRESERAAANGVSRGGVSRGGTFVFLAPAAEPVLPPEVLEAARLAEANAVRRAAAASTVQVHVRSHVAGRIAAATALQAAIRSVRLRRRYRAARLASVRVQAASRRYITNASYARLRASVLLVQTVWRGVAARRSFARLKASLLLDEVVACEAMKILVSMRETYGGSARAPSGTPISHGSLLPSPLQQPYPTHQHTPTVVAKLGGLLALPPPVYTPDAPHRPSAPTPPLLSHAAAARQRSAQSSSSSSQGAAMPGERPMPARASELFQLGLRANKEGRTIGACELIQRAAVLAGVPSLSVLLSLANMRLKLGQPSAALLAYRHTLSVADPTGRHAQMARRKSQEALLIGGTTNSKQLSPVGSQLRSEHGDEALRPRARIWLRWLEDEMMRSTAAATALTPSGMGAAGASEGATASPSNANPKGGEERSTPPQRLVAASPSKPTLATRLSHFSRGISLFSEDSYLTEEQLDLLEHLLYDAMNAGGPASRTGPAELAHGGVRLQLGGAIDAVELELVADGPPLDVDSHATESEGGGSDDGGGFPYAPPPQTATTPDESRLLRMHMRGLTCHYQKRSRGGFRLRLGGMPLDAYDLRYGGAGAHVVGVVGTCSHSPPAETRAPRSSDGSTSAATSAVATKLPLDALAQSGHEQHAAGQPPSPRVQMSLSVDRRTRHVSVGVRVDDGDQAADGSESSLLPRPPATASRAGGVDLAVRHGFTPPDTLAARSVSPEVAARDSPLTKRMFSWRWKDTARKAIDKAHGAPASQIQRLVRGWLTRRGAVHLATLHRLSQFSAEWTRERHTQLRSSRDHHPPPPPPTTDNAPPTTALRPESWLVRIEKMPDGSPVHSDTSVLIPTPTEIVCDRLLLDELLDFFRSPHLATRAAQLAFMSEVLLLRQPRRLQVALDIRAPRLVIPFDLRAPSRHQPVIALDMGRLTFMRAVEPNPDEVAAGPHAHTDGGNSDGETLTMRARTNSGSTLGGAPSLAALDAAGGLARSGRGLHDTMYDTYEVRMTDMQALLITNGGAGDVASSGAGGGGASSAGGSEGSTATAGGTMELPAEHAIVERFHLALRYQKRRLPTASHLPNDLGIDPSSHSAPPRHRLTLRIAPELKVRISARQYHVLRGLVSALSRGGRRSRESRESATSTAAPPPAATPPTPAPTPRAESAPSERLEALLTMEAAGQMPMPRMRRSNSTSSELSQRLYLAARRMLRAHAADVDLHALLLVPAVGVEILYLPHGAQVEVGLLDVQLVGLRSEVMARTEHLSVDVRLRAIYARDLTHENLPYLATSDLASSYGAPSAEAAHAAGPAPAAAASVAGGGSAFQLGGDEGTGAEREPSVVHISYEKSRRTAAQSPLAPSTVDDHGDDGSEPSVYRVVLQALHVEWNAPCIATLRRVLSRKPSHNAAAPFWPEPKQYTHSAADGVPPLAPPPRAPRSRLRAEVHVSMQSLSLSLNTHEPAAAAAPPAATAAPPATAGSVAGGAAGPPHGRSAVLCVLTAVGLQLDTCLHRDGTISMDGCMEELSAHDHRKRQHAVRHPPRTGDDGGFATPPPVASTAPAASGPPMIHLTRSTDGAALRFEYRRFYTEAKRPVGAGVTFEGELRLHVACMRVIWLQQWIAGAFEYLDESILAKVVRGVSDLSIARVWVPPNRFRPMRLKFAIAQPTILCPRNVHALDSEELLAQHSLHVRLRAVTGESVLLRRAMPGCTELGPLLCDQMAIRFTDVHISSQLPPDGPHALPCTPPEAPLELTLMIIKSIERPNEHVPSMAIDAAIAGPRGLCLECTLAQSELLWRIWRENIARPGRSAAGALGVWGMLARPDKLKNVSVVAAPLSARVYAAAGSHATAERTLLTLHASKLHFRAAEMQTNISLLFELPRLGFDVYMPPPGASTRFPVLVGDWDFTMRAVEHFPFGCTYPLHASRWIVATQPLHVHMCERRLAALTAIATRFVGAATHSPNPVGVFPEREPDLRLRCALPDVTLHLYSAHLAVHAARAHAAARVPPMGGERPPFVVVDDPSGGADGSCEVLQMQLSRVAAEYNSWCDPHTETTGRVSGGACVGSVRVLNSIAGAEDTELLALPSAEAAAALMRAEGMHDAPNTADAAGDGGSNGTGHSSNSTGHGSNGHGHSSNGDGGGESGGSAMDALELPPLEAAVAELRDAHGDMMGLSVGATGMRAQLMVTWRMMCTPQRRSMQELRARVAPASLRLDARSARALLAALAPMRTHNERLGALGPHVAARVMLYGAYRDTSSRGGAASGAGNVPPLRIDRVILEPMALAVGLSVRRSGMLVRQLGQLLLGDAVLTADTPHAPAHAGSGASSGTSFVLRFGRLTLPHMRASSAAAYARWHYYSHVVRVLLLSALRSWRLQVLLSALAAMLVAAVVTAAVRGLGVTPLAPPPSLGAPPLLGWLPSWSPSVEADESEAAQRTASWGMVSLLRQRLAPWL